MKPRTTNKPAKELKADGWRCLTRPVKPGSAELEAITAQLDGIRYILRELATGLVEVWRDEKGWLNSHDDRNGRPTRRKRQPAPMPEFVREYFIGRAEAEPDCNRTLKVLDPRP